MEHFSINNYGKRLKKMHLIRYKIKEKRIKKAVKNNYLRYSNYCGGQVPRIIKNEEDAQILLNLINNVALDEYKSKFNY